MLQVHQFACLSDNYGFLLHDPGSQETACIDTPDAEAYLREANAKGWQITQIWNTHWHPDHAGGNAAIKAATGCVITGPAEVEKLGTAPDRVVAAGDTVALGEFSAHVIDVSGHTNGHIAYHLPEADTAFVGDAVFALGCGRMFEGQPDQFWASLSRIKALPPATLLYCAHEYTASNARFALHADPDNAELADYAAHNNFCMFCSLVYYLTFNDIPRRCSISFVRSQLGRLDKARFRPILAKSRSIRRALRLQRKNGTFRPKSWPIFLKKHGLIG